MKFDGRTVDYEPIKPPAHRGLIEPSGVDEWPHRKSGFYQDTSALRGKPERSDEPQPALKSKVSQRESAVTSLNRGHTLTFILLFVYVILAYFRPYELTSKLDWTVWLPFWLAIAMLAIFGITQFAQQGNLTARPREVNLVLLLTVTALLSIPLAASRVDAWDMFTKIFIKTILVFIVMVNVMRSERRLKLMIFLAFAAGFYMSWVALSDYGAGVVEEGIRARAAIKNLFGEPNAMSLHLVMMIPIAITLALSSSNGLKKILYGFGALLMIAGNFATQSRGGFLGIVAAGGALAWKLGRRNRFLMIGVIVVAMLATLAFAPGGYGSRMATIFNPDADPNGSAAARRELFKRSVTVAIYNPVFGVGIGNFPIVGIRGQVSHNAYTQVAAEMGIAAFVFYILLIISAYKRLREIERETLTQTRSRFYYLGVGLHAGLTGYLVASFFLSVAYEWYVYFLVAYVICLHGIYKTSVKGQARGIAMHGTPPAIVGLAETSDVRKPNL